MNPSLTVVITVSHTQPWGFYLPVLTVENLASWWLERLPPFCLTLCPHRPTPPRKFSSFHGSQNDILSGMGGVGEEEGTQVPTTQVKPAWPHKVYCVTSGHQLDSSRGCKECSNISLFPEKKEAEMEVNGTLEQAPNIFKGQDILQIWVGCFLRTSLAVTIAKFLCSFLGNLVSVSVSLILGRKTDKRKN